MNMMHNSYAMSYGSGSDGSFVAPLPSVTEKMETVGMSAAAGELAIMVNTTQAKPPYDSDAPIVTPTITPRMTLSKAFLRKNVPTLPLTAEYQNQNNSSTSSSNSHLNTTATAAAPQNPLDLLSTVSTQVANKDNHDKRNQQASPNHHPYIGERNYAGLRHGRGIMTYPNGCHYNGCFVNDKRHGFGECWYPNGCVYTGFWSDGKRDGAGKMIYADRGDVYEGEWMADRRHGRGLYFRADGRVDVARYVCHNVAGEGTQWSPNREFVVQLLDGMNRGPISVGRAMEIDSRIGIPGVPKQMFLPKQMFSGFQFNQDG
eukprot:CAMPEP_0201939242 /NCGR_PEP_ID=MMETSP0903-20130614/42824_1 /ASSEMBLY_ACC=CAM_ASM_000552 /TAXON_ID=420261 /ORGANISM="Thalassiosira antarctica, Strain CCMP982" /LENGTH=315 /DNA_ID=CAMNT_0048480717 /DNA_START=48 /DNA_END=995 /DNA_ORIENTATION=-